MVSRAANVRNSRAKCDSLSFRSRHGSLTFRWRKWMLRYNRGRNKLLGRVACGSILVLLLVPAPGRAQAQISQAAGGNRQTRAKAKKKRAPERTFVLVGAGDIASCKNPEGARATAKLIEQIPGTVFAAGDVGVGKSSTGGFKKLADPASGRL